MACNPEHRTAEQSRLQRVQDKFMGQTGESSIDDRILKHVIARITDVGLIIVPKLIDQLVFKGDGKIDIMLSPKDLGKVEFSFQSHDKSGLSIAILAERDETAALVRRHMDVLTKEFERLGYSDIDFSCDGQSEQQKSKSGPTNERENTDNTNPQQSKAQSGSITAYGYSLSTAIDIRL